MIAGAMRSSLLAAMLLSAAHLTSATILLDASECRDVACATGYTGTAGVSCPTDGEFDLTGCVPLCVLPTDTTGYVTTSCDTTNAAITEADCTVSCASGYRSVGNGPADSCTSGFGTFTFSGCEAVPKCALPSDTTGYITTSCTATDTSKLDESQCTVSCDTANNYGPSGTATDTCTASSGSTDNTGIFALSGCVPMCTLPTTTTGYITTGCTGTRTSAQCTVTCDQANGYTGTDPTDTCTTPGGEHGLSGCTLQPKCTTSTQADIAAYTTLTSCTNHFDFQCSPTCNTPVYTGTASDACTDGNEFVHSGCSKVPTCTLPTTTTGYITTGCNTGSGALREDQCSLTCDTANEYAGTAVDACSTDGGEFALSGCPLNPKCSVPSDTTGYTTAGCDTSGGTRFASQCTVLCDTANNYAGTGSDACASDGGTFTFSGCLPQCTAPTTTPTGYVVNSCSGTILASQCAVSCDTANNYAGTVEVTCGSAGGTFGFAGCSPIPKCTLPTSSAGYDTTNCNTGRGSAYGITEAQCTLSCADGYTGSAVDTCATDGGEFAMTGCERAAICGLPSSTVGYTTTRCDTVSVCSSYPMLDVSSCSTECDIGYTGTASDACASDGGDFTLSGCVPMCVRPTDTTGYNVGLCDTTSGAITEAQCTVSCATDYRSVGNGPADSCTTGFGVFTYSGCEAVPKCNLPSDTTGYITTSCSATSTNLLLESECTVSCDTANGYGPSGTATDTCTATSGTPTEGIFSFSGCVNQCTLPTTTTGYITTGCTGTKTSAQCTVTCDQANGYTGTNPTDTCATPGGEHAFSGCTLQPKCTTSTQADIAAYSTLTSCTNHFDFQCSPTCNTPAYTGTAVDSCTDGNEFVHSGCTKVPTCTLPTTTTGYITTGCNTASSALREDQCTVTCDSGNNYELVPGETQVTETCASDGGEFALSGCRAIPKCSASDTTGYTITGCDTTNGNRYASACTAACATNWANSGTITETCASEGASFVFANCYPQCNLPTTPTGYTISGCSGSTIAQSCTVGCASGYTGTAALTCPAAGETMQFSGCSEVPKCTLPATGTPGYVTTSCNPGRDDAYGITAAQCSVSCAAGYTGSATATCAQAGEFTLAGCTRMDTCILPSTTTGYKTTWCDTSGYISCTTTGDGVTTSATSAGGTSGTGSNASSAPRTLSQGFLWLVACVLAAMRF